jgi:hypothetical protein
MLKGVVESYRISPRSRYCDLTIVQDVVALVKIFKKTPEGHSHPLFLPSPIRVKILHNRKSLGIRLLCFFWSNL